MVPQELCQIGEVICEAPEGSDMSVVGLIVLIVIVVLVLRIL